MGDKIKYAASLLSLRTCHFEIHVFNSFIMYLFIRVITYLLGVTPSQKIENILRRHMITISLHEIS